MTVTLHLIAIGKKDIFVKQRITRGHRCERTNMAIKCKISETIT